MSSGEHDLPKTDQGLLDLLVDGELPDAQRRELLTSLDRTEGGWRACALAFLEAQCFGESLKKAAAESASRSQIPVVRTERPMRWAHHAGTFLAVAATFLVALGVGWWAGGLYRSMGPAGLVSSPVANLVAGQPGAAVSGPLQPAAPAAPGLPASDSPTMTLALPAWGEGGPIQLPVVERDQLDHSLLYPDAHAFPAPLREALRRAGFHVQQSRELLPVSIQDGRHAILPVDQVDIRYVGNHVE